MKKILSTGPGLVLGIPTLGRPVPLDWALALKGMNPPMNYNVNFSIVRGKDVADAREAIAEVAVREDAKYLYFMGDDTLAPPHTLRQLIHRMENVENCGIVGGVYCCKSDPPAPLVFVENGRGSYWDWKIGEFFECSGLGMDATLIRVDVLKELKKPWFKTVDTDKYLDGKNEVESWTEDLFFLKKVKEETNWKIYCDASVICEHHDVYSGRVYKLPPGSLPLRQKGVVKDKRCLILGPRLDLMDDSYDIITAGPEGSDYRVQWGNLPFEEKEFDRVIVSEPLPEYAKYLNEWKRVLKSGMKLSINMHLSLDKDFAVKIYDAKLDGTFLELIKP